MDRPDPNDPKYNAKADRGMRCTAQEEIQSE